MSSGRNKSARDALSLEKLEPAVSCYASAHALPNSHGKR